MTIKNKEKPALHQLVFSIKIEKGVKTAQLKHRTIPPLHDELRLSINTNDYGVNVQIPLAKLADVPWYLIPDQIGSYVADTLTSYPPFKEWCESFSLRSRR